METTLHASRAYRGVRIVRCLSVVGMASIAIACRDAIENAVAPVSPTFNVSVDGGWVVNSLADPGDGECTNNECTLREALAAAQDGDRVTFKGNLSGTIALTAGELSIDDDVSVVGPGADVITVNAQNASRVFDVGGPGAPVSATISGLTITGGNEPASVGGGIRVGLMSTLAVAGSEVIDNAAIRGAGIHSAGTLVVVGTTVASNDASSGGGGIYSNGHLAVNGSTISGNTSGGAGGAIYAECNQGGFCGIIVSMRSSTITLNNAVLGGGLYLFSDDATLRNTIIAGNETQGDPMAPGANCIGAGISSSGYTLSINGCGTSHPTDVVVAFSDLFTLVLAPTLALNGGQVRTHALIERGFAVDAGSCPGERVDQRVFPRPYDDPLMPNALDSCDIGAFEWQPASTKPKGPKP